MMNKNDELYFKRLKLYMEVTYYDIHSIKDEVERYIERYDVDDIMKKVVLNKESYLNIRISEVEALINEMEPDKYISDEIMEPLLRSEGVLYRLKTVKQSLREYVLNYNCNDLI